jgi:hypothetical protein
VTIRARTEKETQPGPPFAECSASNQIEPSPIVGAMYEKLAHNELPPGSVRKDSARYLDETGRIKEKHAVPLDILPEPFQSFANQCQDELYDHATRTVNAVRWRLHLKGKHNPFGHKAFEWSFDGEHWNHMPSSFSITSWITRALRVSDAIRREIETLVIAGGDEPIGHKLYREAYEQRFENPRSALVIGIAAAEVGFKQCVVSLLPDTEWLVDNAPSPPLVKMLLEYLPRLPAKCRINDKVIPPPPKIIEQLKKGITLRNAIVHIGSKKITGFTIEEILLAVQDLLWLLDYYRGVSWAIDWVRDETKKELFNAK